ncbi:hypothetical protein G6011_06319 [Alternaria panax]|uniref:Uncharacterized protein n=1 Tax=Alternaria panax TaxID=48097 RepID=A0AAD4FIU4_9PLEO|nr:hypothetical protein G6011_06319 [Alternaria panax]
MNYPRDARDNLTQCYECMRQAGVDVDNIYEASSQLRRTIHRFCEFGSPCVYELLATFLEWLKSSDEPLEHNTKLGAIPSITRLAYLFTSTGEIGESTVMFGSSQTTKTPLSESRRTSGDAIPVEYLQQVPTNWPYTRYGAARKAGQTTSFPLTHDNSTGVTVAWLLHKMLWNPRPLFTPLSARNDMYQPVLQDWMPAFLDASALSMATHASTTSPSIETLDAIVTPATPATPAMLASDTQVSSPTMIVPVTTTPSFVATPSFALPTSTSTSVPITPPMTLPTPSTSSFTHIHITGVDLFSAVLS